MTLYEELNPKDIEISQILPVINKFLPNIHENDVKFLYHGTYNVFEINEEFIFRIPDKSLRNEIGIQLLEKENKVLQLFNSTLPIPIPKPSYINLENNIPVMGYRKIPGISLSKCFGEFDNSCLIKVAKSIGEFLTQLHSSETIKKYSDHFHEDYGNFFENYREIWEKEYREVQSCILPMGFSVKPNAAIVFDTSNILVDPLSCSLSGVIDFEETRIFDPAIDFLFFREGELFLRKIMTTYNREIDKSFSERMQFTFSRVFAPYVLYGVDNNIPSLITAGLELLSDRMRFFPKET